MGEKVSETFIYNFLSSILSVQFSLSACISLIFLDILMFFHAELFFFSSKVFSLHMIKTALKKLKFLAGKA